MPWAPAALLSSLKASSTDLLAACPKRPAAPVSDTTIPAVWVQAGDWAMAPRGTSAAAVARAAAESGKRILLAPFGFKSSLV